MYHHIAEQQGGDKTMWLSAAQFEAQLAWLKENGYQPVTMRRVYDAWTGRDSLPARPVVLSFDDGYVDQVRVAGPIMHRYGWPGEIAVIFNLLYKGSSPPATVLTPALVQELLDDGWGLQSHSVSHPDLRAVSATQLAHEFVYSRKRLQQIFHVPVEFFCYPGGAYNQDVERAAAAAGYLAATSVDYGAATPTDLYALRRIHVYWGEPAAEFGASLRNAVAKAAGKG
jgi:peptidoglycan/xylan/chitin deacetylase (PgdA/CDA1 family)